MRDCVTLLAAPKELYETHVQRCLGAWDQIRDRMTPALARLFAATREQVACTVDEMIHCHDIGKLSHLWQERIRDAEKRKKSGPPHATLGAPCLLYLLGHDGDIGNAAALAILMHHTDSGLAYGNLEHPAEDAINRGLVMFGGETFRWAEGAQEALNETFENSSPPSLAGVTLNHLERLATDLRGWSRCPKELQRHQHRLQALALHHVLKVCDWRAACQREDERLEDPEGDATDSAGKETVRSILEAYEKGGLLP